MSSLRDRFDKLNKLYREVNEEFREYCCPRVVYLELIPPTTYGGDTYTHIGWARVDREYQICIGYSRDNELDDWIWLKITDATLDVRMRMIKVLPELEKTIQNECESIASEIDSAIHDLEKFLESTQED